MAAISSAPRSGQWAMTSPVAGFSTANSRAAGTAASGAATSTCSCSWIPAMRPSPVALLDGVSSLPADCPHEKRRHLLLVTLVERTSCFVAISSSSSPVRCWHLPSSRSSARATTGRPRGRRRARPRRPPPPRRRERCRGPCAYGRTGVCCEAIIGEGSSATSPSKASSPPALARGTGGPARPGPGGAAPEPSPATGTVPAATVPEDTTETVPGGGQTTEPPPDPGTSTGAATPPADSSTGGVTIPNPATPDASVSP